MINKFNKILKMKMKTIKLITTTFILISISATSQITKGNFMVGGTGNFSSYQTQYLNNGNEVTNKGVGLNISPNIGYFLANKFVVGAGFTVGYTKQNGQQSSIGYNFGPFARYYFLKEDKRINLFTEVNYFIGNSKSGSNKSESNGYGFKAGPVIFFNSSVGLEVTLDYSSSKLIPSGSTNSTFNNLQIGLGLQIHLEK